MHVFKHVHKIQNSPSLLLRGQVAAQHKGIRTAIWDSGMSWKLVKGLLISTQEKESTPELMDRSGKDR